MYSIPSTPRSVSGHPTAHGHCCKHQASSLFTSCRSRVWTEWTPCPHTHTHTHPVPYPCPLKGRPEKLRMLVSCGCHVKAPKLRGWNNRNEFSRSLEARCEVKVLQGQFLLEGPCPKPAMAPRLPTGLACGRHCTQPPPALLCTQVSPTFPHQAPLSGF